MSEKRVKGYPFDKVRQKEELVFKTYEYDLPFNYENITVWRKDCAGGEFHGIELLTTNAPSPKAELGKVVPGEWTLMQTSFVVPPETATAEFRLDIAQMVPGGEFRIADAFAGAVPDSWKPFEDIPAGAKNLIANPKISGEKAPPAGWKMDTAGTGSITPEPKDKDGRAGLKFREAQVSLYTEVPVNPGQRLVYALWVKSTGNRPGVVWLFPKWKNRQGLYLSDVAGDCIIVEEKHPIVRVVVIGGACTPPGYVQIECIPYEGFYHRGDFVRCTAPVRFRQNNLWGTHIRGDQWCNMVPSDFSYEDIPAGLGKRYPGIEKCKVKAHYQEFPSTGMSCAVFEVPKSHRVIIQGGSESPNWTTDFAPDDNHYSFRMIRTTVAVPSK